MSKNPPRVYIKREDSVGIYEGETFIEPADPLKALITHWARRSDGLYVAERNPAVESQPFNPGTRAFVTPNQKHECGFYPVWVMTTFGMVPYEDWSVKETYEDKINALISSVVDGNWPDHLIFPHTHTAYVDENGDGYTVSVDYDSGFMKFPPNGGFFGNPNGFKSWLEDPDFTPDGVPWSLPYHTHKVVNWVIQPAAASINVDKTQPQGFYDEDGNWIIGADLDLIAQESQIHGHFRSEDVMVGEQDTPANQGKTTITYVANQTKYESCDVMSIESVNFHMNKEAFLEEGVTTYAPYDVTELWESKDAKFMSEGEEDPDFQSKKLEIIQKSDEAIAIAKEYLRPKTINWLDSMFNNSVNYYDHRFTTYYSNSSTHRMKYNYNQEKYEKASKFFDKSTHLLPNLYSFALLDAGAAGAFQLVPALQNIVTLGIKENGKFILQPAGGPISGFNFFSMNEYFKLWAKTSEKVADATFSEWWAKQAKHTIFDHTGNSLRNQYNDRKDIFPMYSELSIEAKIGPIPSSNPFAPGTFTNNYFANKLSKNDKNKSYAIRWLMEKMVDDTEGAMAPFSRAFYREDENTYRLTKNDRKVWDMSPLIRCPDNLLNLINSNTPDVEHQVNDALVLTLDPHVSPDLYGENELNSKLYSEIFLGNMGVHPGDAGMIFSGLTDLIKNAHGHHSSGDDEPSHEGSNKIEKLAGEYFRCMPGVYSTNKDAYSEILFFRIDKYDADWPDFDPEFEEVPEKNAPQILQTYWIPQPLEGALINFVDTQVKYGNSYRYKVFAYSLVAGNQYKYLGHVNNIGSENEFGEPDLVTQEASSGLVLQDSFIWIPAEVDGTPKPVAEVVVENRPSVYLMAEPYFDFATIGVVDDPPLPPNVQIVPYKNVNDKMLFLLSQNIGETKASPVLIEPEDFEKFMLIFKTQIAHSGASSDEVQNIISQMGSAKSFMGAKMQFRSDDYIKQYQVFRSEKKPTSYKDFAGFLRQPELEMKQDAFIDTLTPNKKYYYIFRAVDIHGSISNPTAVYEVELVFNSGATYPVIKVVDFETVLPQVKEKPMRRFIHIVPSFAQSKMSVATYDWGGGSKITEPVFGDVFSKKGVSNPKKFKIRFTSKSTGRKFDLNLKILHEQDSGDRWAEYKKKREQEFLMTSEEMKDKKWLQDY